MQTDIELIAFSVESLKRAADEIEGWGAGNEAAQVRWAAETIATLRREVEQARAKHESLKTLTIERSERLREADSRALRLDAEVFDLRWALEPFRAWALDNLELVPGSIDADGEVTNGYYQWKHAPMRERIVDWFGPSDFGAAIRSLADKEG